VRADWGRRRPRATPLVQASPADSLPLPDEYAVPCTINGVMAAASGGALGFVFGAGSRLVRHSGAGRLRAAAVDGRASARSFALFGGVYTAAACIAGRLRDAEDAWNGALAGCATGAVMGVSGGPAAALQSCALFGAFSYFIDRMQAGRAVAAESEEGGGVRDATPRAPRRSFCARSRPCGSVDPLTAAAVAALPPQLFAAAAWVQRV